MSRIIALAGKGGVGKSTISSQLIRALSKSGIVLAVDADPNSNLGDKLGIKTAGTIGSLRNEVVANPDMVPAGVSKQDYITNHVRQVMAEADNVDLLVMGRPEGEGCYCFTNGVLKGCFADMIPNYKYVVVDNEAGMEHMSRKILPRADVLILVSDPTKTGIHTARRLSKLADEVGMRVSRRILVINNATGPVQPLTREAWQMGFDEVLVMPHDEFISQAAMEGEYLKVPSDTPFGESMAELLALISK